MKNFLFIFMSCMLQFACVTTDAPSHDESKIVHIVMVWLHEPGNKHHINEVIKTTQGLNGDFRGARNACWRKDFE